MTIAVTTATEWWNITIAAPPESQLAPGAYTGAERAPFRSAGHPGLDVNGDGRGCNNVFGSFVIRAISANNRGTVTMLDASFTQHCENAGAPPLTGVVRFHAPAAAPIVVTSSNPSALHYQPVTFTANVTPGATGAVSFFDGTTTIGDATIDPNGIASLTTSELAVGTHSITATYAGTASDAVQQTIRDNDVSFRFASASRDYIGAGATRELRNS